MASITKPGARILAQAVSIALLSAGATATATAQESVRSFEIYGFAQADYIQDIGGRLDPAWDDAFRPSKICFDGACGEDGQASISVKQSRFGVKGTMPTKDGDMKPTCNVNIAPPMAEIAAAVQNMKILKLDTS